MSVGCLRIVASPCRDHSGTGNVGDIEGGWTRTVPFGQPIIVSMSDSDFLTCH